MVKKFAFFLFKVISFFNYFFFKVTNKNFLIYLNQFLRDDSYQSLEIRGQNVNFFIPSPITKWRVETFFSKEPETLEWIDNFDKNKKIKFWDIGGNIGLYSIYAAIKYQNIDITVFEPSTSNLQILSRNISINKLNEKIKICQIPLTNKENLFLSMKESQLEEGGALNCYGEDFNFEGKKFIEKNSYKIYGTSINYFLNNKILEIPNYIKIDVDGIEHLILLGASKWLKNLNIRGLSIEINDNFKDQHDKVLKIMKKNNFKILHKKHNEKIFLNKVSKFSKSYNYVFFR